ncbi:hypothetical protein QQX98_007034 [Neonectria punicea]|uniref:Beta-lactamase-related domain-containing protein n=1 Tax=Neonectria punicea TaxID=979145 RepID=A0ABR1H0D3_9HYPO
MKDLVEALDLATPLFDQIASISGVPGVSLGVFHQGDVVFRYNYGFRDLEAQLPTTSTTIYPLASLTKAFTSMVYGSLVADGLVDWHSPIRDILPEFRSTADEVGRLASAVDILSHRTGVPGGETLYFHGQPLLNDSDHPNQFRGQMLYNNLGYALVAMAMSRKTGQSYEELLESRLLQPLGLTRTGLSFDPRTTEDMAKCYLVTEEKEAVENPRPLFLANSVMVAVGGLRSSVDDLLKFYRTLLRDASQLATTADGTHQSSLKELRTILSGFAPLGGQRTGLLESSYGLGWIRSQLPSELGSMGLNSWLLGKMPVVGRGAPSRLALYHQGNLPGATTAVYLFPETQSGIVVLENAYGLSDVPDWIAQIIIHILFDMPTTTDYAKLAEQAVSNFQQHRRKTASDLSRLPRTDSEPASPHRLLGDYENAAECFFLRISQRENDLKLSFQGFPEEEFDLVHLYDDVYSWYPSSRELAQRGRTKPRQVFLNDDDTPAIERTWQLGNIAMLGWRPLTSLRRSSGSFAEYSMPVSIEFNTASNSVP